MPTIDPDLANTRTTGERDLLERARQCAKSGEKETARTLLRQAALSDPNREEIWLLAASLAETLDEAIEYVEQALLLNPGNRLAAAWVERARKSAHPDKPAELDELLPDRVEAIKISEPVRAVGAPRANPTARPVQASKPAEAPKSSSPARPKPALTIVPPRSAPAWRCPLCEHGAPAPVQKCSQCHAAVDLALISSISRPENVNEELLLQSIERQRQTLAQGPDAKAHVALALAHLNLNRSAEAGTHLQEACRLLPEERDVHAALHTLRQRKLVLIAEESDIVRDTITDLLEGYRLRTRVAQNGFQAVTLVEEEMPDLILASASMPRMNGYELCRVLAKSISTKGIPLVLLADKAGIMERARGRAAGVTNYAVRPVDPMTLLMTLKSHLPDSTLPDPKLVKKTLLKI